MKRKNLSARLGAALLLAGCGMVGSYRDLRSSRSASARKGMVDNYTRAVESANGP